MPNFNSMTPQEGRQWLAERRIACEQCAGAGEYQILNRSEPGFARVCATCGGTGKVVQFPTLRQKCFGATQLQNEEGTWHQERWHPQTPRANCSCQGRGWVTVNSLEATAKAGWLVFHHDTPFSVTVERGMLLDLEDYADYVLAILQGDNDAAILALCKAVEAKYGQL